MGLFILCLLYFTGDKEPRLYKLRHRSDHSGYGIILDINRTRFGFKIAHVEPNSPAHAIGLREGDLVVEINDKPVTGSSYMEVMTVIRDSTESLSLMVVDSNAESYYFEREIERAHLSRVHMSTDEPRAEASLTDIETEGFLITYFN